MALRRQLYGGSQAYAAMACAMKYWRLDNQTSAPAELCRDSVWLTPRTPWRQRRPHPPPCVNDG